MNTIIKDGFVAAFVNTDQPARSKKFICLKVQITGDSNNKISVSAIEDVFYPHPDAPDAAVIPVRRERFIKELDLNKQEAAAYKSFLSAHEALLYQLQGEFVF